MVIDCHWDFPAIHGLAVEWHVWKSGRQFAGLRMAVVADSPNSPLSRFEFALADIGSAILQSGGVVHSAQEAFSAPSV